VDSRKRFLAAETMCRERAQIAKKEFEYWLAEADEWARYKDSSSDPLTEDIPRSNSTGVRDIAKATQTFGSQGVT
jgi:hypothetical protein